MFKVLITDPISDNGLKMLEDNPIYTVDERIHIPTNKIQNAPRYQYDHYICEKIGVLYDITYFFINV